MNIELLWLVAPLWKLKLLTLIMVAQIILTCWLYIQLSKARVSAVKTGVVKREDYSVIGNEPEELAIYTRAVANQFELPVVFYVLILTGMTLGVSSLITVFLAALFVIIRIIHAREMVGQNRVVRRRKLFIYSVRVFVVMIVELVISTLVFV